MKIGTFGKYHQPFSEAELNKAKALPTKQDRVNWVKNNYERIMAQCGTNLTKRIISIAGIGMTRKELRFHHIPGRPKVIRLRTA